MGDPAILFFVFGIVCGVLRVGLEIPEQIVKFLSLYLLMSLGLKGGFALSGVGFSLEVLGVLGIGILMSLLVPILGYIVLRGYIGRYNALGVSATYGSVSAVTFVTCGQYLVGRGIEYDGYMAAVMTMMEIPAILFAVGMGRGGVGIFGVLRSSLLHGSTLLLLGSLLIGYVTGVRGEGMMKPFTAEIFKGLLSFFLLDMGLRVAGRLSLVWSYGWVLMLYGILGPLLHALMCYGLCWYVGISGGNMVLLMILSGSASYIAVPAVLGEALPEADSGMYVGLSLGLTFPLNILLGIPLYTWLVCG